MHPSPRYHSHRRAHRLSPGQRWWVWMLVQAVLALTLAAGPRGVLGPLHAHEGPGLHHAHHGGAGHLARHHHDSTTDMVMLEEAAVAVDDMGTGPAAAAAAALLWPARFSGLSPPAMGREAWARPVDVAPRPDADLMGVEHRPRA